MKKKLGLGVVLAGAVLAGVYMLHYAGEQGQRSPTGRAAGTSQAPNILILIADDVGVDKISSYAEDADPDYPNVTQYLPSTPVIDSLAEHGVRFTDAWAAPSCSPTRAMMYTGNYGFRTSIGSPLGKPGQGEMETEDSITMAEMLSEEGYTSALIGKWHLGWGSNPESWSEGDQWEDHQDSPTETELHPITHGFQSFSGTLGGELDEGDTDYGYTDWLRIVARKCEGCNRTDVAEATETSDYATTVAVDDALNWVDRQSGSWMLTMAFHAPHTPMEAPDSSCTYAEDPGSYSPTERPDIFRAMLECLDIHIGELLYDLRDQGELDDTLIVFVGDNGTVTTMAEGPFDDDRGKATTFESGIRVPMIITDGRTWMAGQDDFTRSNDWFASPRFIVDPGTEIADLVHVADVYATVAEVAGADGSSGQDSISLLPLLEDTDGKIREVIYSEMFNPTEGTGNLAIRKGDWKMRVSVNNSRDATCRRDVELYDLSSDRFEQTDLAETETEALSELLGELDDLAATHPDPWFDVDNC